MNLRITYIVSLLINLPILFIASGCSLVESDSYVINDETGIYFHFDDGLNDDPKYRLPKDDNGFYFFELGSESQNIQRISVRLLRDGKVFTTPWSGSRHKVEWESNLYWWLMEGDTVANITKRYFNPYTGEYEYVNLPPLINWRDHLVPVINSSSVTNESTGRVNTAIGPIGDMKGDTMTVFMSYDYTITKQEKGSMFFESLESVIIRDSVKIILK